MVAGCLYKDSSRLYIYCIFYKNDRRQRVTSSDWFDGRKKNSTYKYFCTHENSPGIKTLSQYRALIIIRSYINKIGRVEQMFHLFNVLFQKWRRSVAGTIVPCILYITVERMVATRQSSGLKKRKTIRSRDFTATDERENKGLRQNSYHFYVD